MATNRYEHEYTQPDKYVILHDEDPDLHTIRIRLPKPPHRQSIAGYGRRAAHQKWERPTPPPKLDALMQRNYLDPLDYWDEIASNYEYYQDELWFIEQEWDRRLNGYWFYNNGKPTYIDGWHYFFLTACEADNENGDEYPSYRDRDRKFFIACKYLATTTEAVFNYRYKKDGKGEWKYTSDKDRVKAIHKKEWPLEEGPYVVKLGERTVFGVCYNKMRREGATTKACAINIEIGTRSHNSVNGIQSKTEKDAEEKVFKKILVRMWRGLPFYYKPVNDNNPNPVSEIKMAPKGQKGKSRAEKQRRVDALYSVINFGSSTEGFYDGDKLRFYHGDEVGKTTDADVSMRHKIVKQCLSVGGNRVIVGFGVYTSTVGDMVKGGGSRYKIICDQSHWERRMDTGQTISGMVNIYIPSYEGLEGYIDEYGNSLKDKAKEDVLAQRKALLEAGDEEGYVELVRQIPFTWKESFTAMAGNNRFNLHKLTTRLGEFTFMPNPFVVRGRLEWKGEVHPNHEYRIQYLPTVEDFVKGKAWVEFVPDAKGFWEVSYIPENKNSFFNDTMIGPIPTNVHSLTFGVDMFRVNEKTSKDRPSDGAGAIYIRPNPNKIYTEEEGMQLDEDGDFVDKTKRFGATYLGRPSKREFKEQMLMASMFWSVKCFPEVNLSDIWEHFEDRGFPGYLQFRVDVKTGKELKVPGYHTTADIVARIFNLYADYIETSALRENHLTLLEQCLEIETKMNDYDLFTAGGYALLADEAKSVEYEPIEDVDLSDIFPQYEQ